MVFWQRFPLYPFLHLHLAGFTKGDFTQNRHRGNPSTEHHRLSQAVPELLSPSNASAPIPAGLPLAGVHPLFLLTSPSFKSLLALAPETRLRLRNARSLLCMSSLKASYLPFNGHCSSTLGTLQGRYHVLSQSQALHVNQRTLSLPDSICPSDTRDLITNLLS